MTNNHGRQDMTSLVGVVGDFNMRNHTHVATNRALEVVGLPFEWVPTTELDGDVEARLARYHGLWIAPASPYLNMDGALEAIRYARERGVPLVAT
jgi:CTP synthase (UTP-ammonia lyase)